MATPHHVSQHSVAPFYAVFWMRYGVVSGGSFEHTYKRGSLFGSQIFRCGVKVGFACCFNSVGRRAKVYCVSIHREDGVFIVAHFQFSGDNPFFGFHDEHTNARDFAQQSRRIFGAHPKEVFSQLLRNGRRATSIAFCDGILGGSKHTDGVYAPVAIETFIFGVDKRIPKHGVNISVSHGCAVFVEIFANEFSIGTINFGCLCRNRVVDGGPSWRLTEEPKEVDVYHTEV